MTDQSYDEVIIELVTLSLLAVVKTCADIAADTNTGPEVAEKLNSMAIQIIKNCLDDTLKYLTEQPHG